ncbi:MAG: hypothetical protein SGJ20_13685 [Planctomycetota bacterium]|nr:hypothetical protein [Planctomycetota bacterium]
MESIPKPRSKATLAIGLTLTVCAVVAVVFAVRAQSPKLRVEDIDSRVVKLFAGPQSVENILSPTKIEAFRIDGRVKQRDRTRPLVGYPILTGPVEVEATTGQQLATILLNDNAYWWEAAKACMFNPGLVVRYTKNGKSTEIYFCFSCDELLVISEGKGGGTEDTDAIRGPLVEIAKKIFPDDKEIDALE